MGDNKISEAAALAASLRQVAEAQYTRRQRFNGRLPADVQEVLRMAADHLQGEAVPVAEVVMVNDVRKLRVYPDDGLPSLLQFPVGTKFFTHPQPAELNEVSGNSGELLDPMVSTGNVEADNAISRLMSDDPDFNDCEMAAALIRRMALDLKGPDGFATWKDAAVFERQQRVALAATGKQQVGEVQGPREQFDAWLETIFVDSTRWGDGEYTDPAAHNYWQAWQAGIASRQPVCETCSGWGRIGGPSFYAPDEGGDPCPDCNPPAQALSPIATRKLEELAGQGYVTNGVAIFNPETGKRGLVDNLGYVGWQGARGLDLGQFIEKIAQEWDGCHYDAVGETLDIGRVLRAQGKQQIDGRDAGAGCA